MKLIKNTFNDNFYDYENKHHYYGYITIFSLSGYMRDGSAVKKWSTSSWSQIKYYL